MLSSRWIAGTVQLVRGTASQRKRTSPSRLDFDFEHFGIGNK